MGFYRAYCDQDNQNLRHNHQNLCDQKAVRLAAFEISLVVDPKDPLHEVARIQASIVAVVPSGALLLATIFSSVHCETVSLCLLQL